VRILVLNWRDLTHPWAGGAELNLHEQARRWVAAGHQVTLFCGRYAGQSGDDWLDGVHVVRRGGRFTTYLWAAYAYLTRLARGTDVILDLENGIPFFTPLYAPRPKVLLIHHIHQEQFNIEFSFPLNAIGRWLESRLMPLVYRRGRYIAISDTTRQGLIAMGVPNERIDVIPPGIDHSQFGPGAAKSRDPTILYVGRLKAYKRVDVLVRLMPRVLEQVPDARLIVLGRGEMESRLKRQAHDLGLDGHAVFKGFVEEAEKVRLLQRAWVNVIPSVNEGWGISAIEANACGTPCVAFRVPGLSDSIRDGETGRLVQSEGEMAEAIISMLLDPEYSQELGEGGLRWAHTFGWENTAARTLGVLERAVREAGRPRAVMARVP